jgi:hypothetical protein
MLSAHIIHVYLVFVYCHRMGLCFGQSRDEKTAPSDGQDHWEEYGVRTEKEVMWEVMAFLEPSLAVSVD